MTFRAKYWSCSKFADRIRGTKKLSSGTAEEWRDWRKAAKSLSAVRYWIAEELLDKIQDFVNWPFDRMNDVRYYVNNRYISRSHALTAHRQDIKPGEWCDVGNRFLPCLFNELVDFVEVEQAWHHVQWDEEARNKFNTPWSREFFRLRTWRCPEAGLHYLDWASTLVYDENMGFEPDHELYGKPTTQAEAAMEIKELYLWWTQVYRNRPDPYEVSGWSEICEERRKEHGDDGFLCEETTEEGRARTRESLDKINEIEAAYEKEDEEMMVRLIKVRGSLWT